MSRNDKTVLVIEASGQYSPHYAPTLINNGYKVFCTTEPDKSYDLLRDKNPKICIIISSNLQMDLHLKYYQKIIDEGANVILIDGKEKYDPSETIDMTKQKLYIKGVVSNAVLLQLCETIIRDRDTANVAAGSRNKTKALVIEDETLTKSHLEVLLKDLNIECQSVESYNEAMECLNARRYGMIISDINIKGGNGLDIYRKLNYTINRLTHFIIISAYSLIEIKEIYGIDSGFAYLEKPVKKNELYNTINYLDKGITGNFQKSVNYSPIPMVELFGNDPKALKENFVDFLDCLRETLEKISMYKQSSPAQSDILSSSFHRLVNIGKYFGADDLIYLIKVFKSTKDLREAHIILKEIERELSQLEIFYQSDFHFATSRFF